MSRLTNQIRQSMLKTVLNHAFSAAERTAAQTKLVAAEKIYSDIYGAHLIAMESLPRGFLEKRSYIYIAIGGQTRQIDFAECKLIGADHYSRHSTNKAKLYVGDELVVAEWLKAESDCDDIEKRRNAMRREVGAVLDSVPTFKKLWEVWPECKSLLEKYEAKPSIAILPAVQVANLNAALGLPVTREADDASE